jgi:hypothetical protein
MSACQDGGEFRPAGLQDSQGLFFGGGSPLQDAFRQVICRILNHVMLLLDRLFRSDYKDVTTIVNP